MNKKELSKIIKSDIIKHFDGYSQHNDLLIKQPIHTLLKGISFDISSWGAVSCTIFVQPLFVPFETYSYLYSFTIRTDKNEQWWDISQNSNGLIAKIKQVENKIAYNLEQPDMFYDYFAKQKTSSIRYVEGLAYTACFMLRSDYRKALKNVVDALEKLNSTVNWEIECLRNAKLLLEFAA